MNRAADRDDRTGIVDQRAAAIAGNDRRLMLELAREPAIGEHARHIALQHRRHEEGLVVAARPGQGALRIGGGGKADREQIGRGAGIIGRQRQRVAGQIVQRLQDRQILLRIDRDHPRGDALDHAPVADQPDREGGALVDHMMVGGDDSPAADQEGGAALDGVLRLHEQAEDAVRDVQDTFACVVAGFEQLGDPARIDRTRGRTLPRGHG